MQVTIQNLRPPTRRSNFSMFRVKVMIIMSSRRSTSTRGRWNRRGPSTLQTTTSLRQRYIDLQTGCNYLDPLQSVFLRVLMLILLCTISVSVSPFQLARVLMYLVICLVESMVYTDTSIQHYIHVHSWDSIFIKLKRICS